jgi:cobalt/nickel transport system ATP-binding protein
MTDASNSASSVPTAIVADGLNYRYPGGEFTLSDVSFSIPVGERVGLIGPSGAGKSTLLMHLNGLLPERTPESSRLEILGLPVVTPHLREIRRLVGFVFQDPDDQLFCPTVREDVAFGPLNLGCSQADALQRMRESLAAVGLSDCEHRSTVQLSQGERKRICLAGVLACQPEILALDEPFSNLDPRNRRGLVEILNRFGKTQIIATHDLDVVAELCDRVLILDDGLIRADGPASELLRDRTLMQRHGLEVPWRYR